MIVFLYLSSIVAANLLVKYFGIVTILGVSFPAGAIMVGLCFSFRDLVQNRFGKYKCWLWMLIATFITILFSPGIAFISGVAFFVSEFLDWLVFTYLKLPIRKRIFISNLVSLPVDSLIFVPYLFGWVWPAIIGQVVVKIISSMCILPLIKRC